jgi:hypothetical protein
MEDEVPYQFEPRPRARRFLPKAVLTCAVMGGIYGAALGSVVGANTNAVRPLSVAAGLLALIGGYLGAKFGFFFGRLNRVRFGQLVGGALGAVFGAMAGAFLALIVLALPGSALGAIGGWLVGRWSARSWRRLPAKILGALLGSCVGAVVYFMQQDQTAARLGTLLGLAVGAVVSPLLLLVFLKALRSLPSRSPY